MVEDDADSEKAASPAGAPMVDDSEAEEEAGEQPAVTQLERVSGMYVVSIVGRSKTRTLHRIV